MAGKLRLASSGGDIKIWDTPELSLVKAFIPHSQPVGSLCWSPNNQCLASAASDKVVVTYVKGDVYSPIEVSSGEGNTCVAFNSSSRYLLIGGKSKTLSIWDMKTKSIKKTYKDHKDVVSCLAFNWNDTAIASGSVNGDILLHNVLTGQASDPIRLAKTQAVRDIQFSYFKKSLFGSVSDDGALNLWDSNSRKLLTSFTADHKAPATGLSFSPMNDMLLCSVGLDKRIVFYDVQGKKSVKVMTAESPLTAVDFMADGATLAVGSTRGKIFIYDLRSGSTPVGTTVAHKTSVQSLSFQSSIKVNSTGISNKSSKPAASKPTNQLPDQPVSTTATSPPSPPTGKQWNSTGQKPTVKQNGLKDDDEDIFSPLREMKTPVINNRLPAHVGSEQDSSMIYKGANTSDVSGIFSPLGSDQSDHARVPLSSNPVLQLDGNAPRTIGETTTNVPTTVQNLRSMNNAEGFSSRSLTNLTPAQDLGATKSYSDTQLITNTGQPSSRPLSDPSAAWLQLGSTFDTRPRLDGGLRKTTEDAYSTESSLGARNGVGLEVQDNNKQPFNSASVGSGRKGHQEKIHGNPVHAMGAAEQLMEHQEATGLSTVGPHITGENRRAEDKVSSEGSMADDKRLQPEPLSSGAVAMVDASSAASGGSGLLPFQVQFIKNLIDESLDEFRVALHRDIVNVQVEMLRQFQIQQNELKAMLEKYSVNEALVTEIERLKEENNRLKSKY